MNATKNPPKEWYTSQEAADYLGVHIATIHDNRRQKKLKAKRFIKGLRRPVYRFHIDELNRHKRRRP